ncbi:protein phosphatase 1 regulatory subunit 3C-B-like isoform X1 [Solea solea]|uniref:protein phosphatase 1 regulatory subunit 3C-B-like isoform X1 n=1 Tax=Solea solea TaxID=90069 RepID=UPI00272C2995|nr:protein phosphatase 1 regulatory subunit 3C-B-like isoform X1 [Solea solea]
MNCRVLHILNPRSKAPPPIMPVDMAMRVCLAGSPPLRSFLDDYDDFCSPSAATLLRPCISSEVSTATETEVETSGSEKKKKSVEFADSRGLALAVVHVFDEAEDDLTAELQFQLAEIEGVTAALNLEDVKDCASDLVLDFTPPAVDYLELRRRLRAQQVCLESCSVHDCRLSGTVQVRNICFQKSVLVRVTFDAWESFQDVRCQFLNNVYGSTDTDTFSFSVELPETCSRVEFCFQYQTKDQTLWDNNLGNNYRLVLDKTKTREEIDIDPYGSPRTSAGIFPEWQSWGRVHANAPYW